MNSVTDPISMSIGVSVGVSIGDPIGCLVRMTICQRGSLRVRVLQMEAIFVRFRGYRVVHIIHFEVIEELEDTMGPVEVVVHYVLISAAVGADYESRLTNVDQVVIIHNTIYQVPAWAQGRVTFSPISPKMERLVLPGQEADSLNYRGLHYLFPVLRISSG